MTCIVGYIENEIIYMGADSAGVVANEITIRKDQKIFYNGKFIIGAAGSFRVIQVLKYEFKPPKHNKNIDTYKYMCTDFVKAMRECFASCGVLEVKDGINEQEGDILVGYRGRLFIIYSDFQVGEHVENYNSVGCGSIMAMSAIKAHEEICKIGLPGMAPEKIVRMALKIATHYSNGVRPPFVVLNTKNLEK